eukprot:1153686-Pelagomonas_calceolata.AAC.2
MDCGPENLSKFVVDLRSRHLGYWNQFTAPDPRVSNSKRPTYHQWCALPVRAAHAIHPPYTLPKYSIVYGFPPSNPSRHCQIQAAIHNVIAVRLLAGHLAWASRARSDQDSIRAAGVASCLMRNTGVKEV